MKGQPVLAAVALLASTIGPASAQPPAPDMIAFVNVNVIAMDREGVEPNRTVIVQSGRITAVGATGDTPLSQDATIVEGKGRYLLPGLTDSHVHVTTDMPWAPARADFGDAPLYLAHGVTSVVNLRGTSDQLAWRRRIESGEIVGPTLYTAGEFVNEPRAITPEDVQREVWSQAKDGFDLIKFHEIWTPAAGFVTGPGLSRESYVRMFEEARKAGLPVVGHAPVNLGLDGLLASSGGAVAHTGELIRLHFRPPVRSFFITLSAAAILLLIVAGWGMTAVARRWRGRPSSSSALTRAKMLTASVLLVFLAALVSSALAGLGGLFYRSLGWRLATTAILIGLAMVALVALLSSSRVWRDATIPTTSRWLVLLAAIVMLVLVYAPTTDWIRHLWRSTEPGIARLANQLRDAGISVQTTLVVYETAFGDADTVTQVLSDRAFASLAPQTQSQWRQWAARPRGGFLASLVAVPPRYAEYTRTIAHGLHRSGVELLAGTDAMGIEMVVPGSSLLLELRLLNESGLTPFEALRTATVNPAKFLGEEAEFGTITVGKRADLVLLEQNPLDDLSTLNRPVGVMARGRWLPRERLDQLLDALK